MNIDPQYIIYVLAAGWFIDNVLAQVPSIKSNSVFQLVANIIDATCVALRRQVPTTTTTITATDSVTTTQDSTGKEQ